MKHLVKKALTSLLVGAMAVGMFAGCGTGGGTTPAASTKMEKIRIWSDNAHEKTLRDEQVAKFNETIGKEKGIEIEYTVYGTGWSDTIKIAAQANDAPELYRPNTTPRDFVSAGYLLPLTDFPGGEEMAKMYDGSLTVNDHVFDGKVYTLPYNLNTYKYVVNVDLFKKAGIAEYPKTWEEVREAAKKITEVGNGVEYGYGLSLQSTWTFTSGMTRQNTVNTGSIGFDNIDTMQFEHSKFLPVVQTLKDMIADGSVLPGYEGMDADMARAQFAEGKIGIMNAASFDVAVFTNQFPAKCDWDVINTPTFGNGTAEFKEQVGGTNLLGFGVAAKKMPEKAMEAFKYFYSDECLAEMYEQGLYIPFRQEAIALAKSEPTQKGFAKFADVPNSLLILPQPDRVISLEGDNFETTMVSILGNKSADAKALLEDCDKRYNEAVAKLDPAVLEEFRAPAGREIKR